MRLFNDPTYDSREIEANPVWKLAFEMSERENDSAPLGWSNYIKQAEQELTLNRSEEL